MGEMGSGSFIEWSKAAGTGLARVKQPERHLTRVPQPEDRPFAEQEPLGRDTPRRDQSTKQVVTRIEALDGAAQHLRVETKADGSRPRRPRSEEVPNPFGRRPPDFAGA